MDVVNLDLEPMAAPADASAAVDATTSALSAATSASTNGSSDAAPSAVATTDATASEPSQTAATPSPMTALTPEIRWHCGPTGLNEAVLSIDFLHPQVPSPSSSSTLKQQPTILATGGADKEIKLWRVSPDLKDHTGLTFVFSLSGHDRSVNCVRFSPNGEFLASASDDSTIIVWTKPKTADADWSWDAIASFSDVARTLLACGHKGDITDLAWSPDSVFLCSTSVDNTSVVWNVAKGEVAERRKDHTQYVQGAAWDPLNEYLVTEGNDRSCRVYALSGFDPVSRVSAKKVANKCVCVQTIKTREFPQQQAPESTAAAAMAPKAAEPQTQDAEPKTPSASATTPAVVAEPAAAPKHRMFLDDTCPAFARRLTWTPDGSYLLAPTGTFRATESAAAVHTVYAFARGNLSAPTLHLPGQEKASLGVRCSPVLYELRDGGRRNFFQTPQRSIFAVITLNTVVIYDTQQPQPVCTLKDLHYADLTDASWSSDGRVLSISSMDGYLSFIQFADGFFGVPVARAGASSVLRLSLYGVAELFDSHSLRTGARPRSEDAADDAAHVRDPKARAQEAQDVRGRRRRKTHRQRQEKTQSRNTRRAQERRE